MNYTVIQIDCGEIRDWDSFHDSFSNAVGFPDLYGRNMDAWIDCMTSLDCPEDAMTSIHAPPGGCVVLQLDNSKQLAARCREIYDALVECSAFVNWRRMERGEPPVLMLAF